MDVDSIVFLLFLFINLFFGIRGIQQATIPYSRFTTANIISAILAITYGGELLSHPFHIDRLLTLTGSTVSYFIIANFLTRPLYLFVNTGSVAEMMGRFYGQPIRKIVALCGVLHTVAIVALQCKILAMAISWFFVINMVYSLLIASFVIVFTVGSNKIQALPLIRVARCATFSIVIPLIAWNLWKIMAGSYNTDQLDFTLAIKDSWRNLTLLDVTPLEHASCFLVCMIPDLYPAQIERIAVSENVAQVQDSFNGAAFASLSINLFLLWVALLVQHYTDTSLLSAISLGNFNVYLGFRGLCMIGIAALTISIADGNLHAATTLITHDLPNVFKWIKKPITYRILLGLLATLVALCGRKELVWFIFSLFKTVVTPSLLLALMGITLHKHSIMAGMIAGGITIVAWFACTFNPGINGLLPAILVNLLAMMTFQCLKNKQRSRHNYLINRFIQEPISKSLPFWKKITKRINIKRFNLCDYLEKKLPKDNFPYIIFSFYILFTGYGSFYTFLSNAAWRATLEKFILLPSLFFATFFFVYTFILPQAYFRKIVSLIWPLAHIYFLFLVGTAMLVISKLAYLHNIIFILNLALSIFITPFLVRLSGCIISSILLWTMVDYIHGNTKFIDSFLPLHANIAYAIFMLFILVSAFCYHHKRLRGLLSTIQALTSEQEEQNARQFFNKQQVDALAYESNCIISQLKNQIVRLDKSEDRIIAYSEQATRLKKYFNSIFKHLKHNLHLATNWISIDQLLAQCFDTIKINNIYDMPYVIIESKQLYIQCAIESIKNLIINSLYACSAYTSLHNDGAKDIHMYIADTQLGYRLTLLQGKLQKIHAISFVITTATRSPMIRPVYKVVEMADIQVLNGDEQNIDSENQHIVHAHYGYYERFCSEAEITYLYVIPVNVKEITKAFAKLSPVVYTQRMVLDPISMQEEALFVEKIKEKQGLNIDPVMDALQLIKVYYTTQRRKTGELFYLHPMGVASILLTIADDANIIVAGLVHDVVQNTPLTEAGLTTLFGPVVTEIVLMTWRLEKELLNQKEHYLTYIEQIISARNYNAILVRLADVLHNARTIGGHTVEKQIEKAKLIQKFYVPLAMLMNMDQIANELKAHSGRVLHKAIPS